MVVPGWAWLIWALLFGGSFAVLERIALKNRVEGDTLSENVWRLGWAERGTPFWRIRRLLLLVLCVGLLWLAAHFITRGLF